MYSKIFRACLRSVKDFAGVTGCWQMATIPGRREVLMNRPNTSPSLQRHHTGEFPLKICFIMPIADYCLSHGWYCSCTLYSSLALSLWFCHRSTLDGLLKIVRNEGVRVLYRGMDINLLVGVPMVSLSISGALTVSAYKPEVYKQGCRSASNILDLLLVTCNGWAQGKLHR